jgi:hypothetical protein
MDLRNQGGSRDVITATPRILESLIRISESLAKMELREEVTAADVEEAVRLIKAATYAAAVDPETGVIDMEMFISGLGAGRRKRRLCFVAITDFRSYTSVCRVSSGVATPTHAESSSSPSVPRTISTSLELFASVAWQRETPTI